jgi:HCOMODA/2-hydroxy-3-carboxy-muconic semialdehyde decarboxylase
LPPQADKAHGNTQKLVRVAARALARAGLVTAFGHCSARLSDREFLVCAAKPMGLIGAHDKGTVVPVDGPLPEGVLGEVRLHQAIYRARSDVNGVCRVLPPTVVGLSVLKITPRPWTGIGAYFSRPPDFDGPPLWDDPLLVRDDRRADGVAKTLGLAPAVVMSGNGAVTVAESLQAAVVLAWFLEEAAKTEKFVLEMQGHGRPTLLKPSEIEARARLAGRVFERAWEHLTANDPEGLYPYPDGD